MRKIYFLILLLIVMILNLEIANAEDNRVVQCNIGSTDGAVNESEWGFTIYTSCSSNDLTPSPGPNIAPNIPNNTCNKKYFYWRFYNTNTYICPPEGCKGDYWRVDRSNSKGSANLDSLFNDSSFYNIFPNGNKNIEGVYSNEVLKRMLENGGCPPYVYIGSSKKKQKIGFIFSGKKIDNAAELLENAGFTVEFTQEGGEDLTALALQNYNNHLNKMKDYVKKYKDNNYAEVYSPYCKPSVVDGILFQELLIDVETYERYKNELRQAVPTFDFSEGDSVAQEYTTLECADKPDDEYIEGDPQSGCEIIPKVIRKWINNALNFARYIALALVIVLGALDFIKAAGSGEPDQMKKAGKSFMKRMIAVVILFLLPYFVDFILNMINIYGVDQNNIDCLK